jgi:cobalt-precorrin 5A hydrolase
MKIAIITLTVQGKKLAQKLSQGLKDDPTVFQADLYHKQVKDTLKEIFHKYDCILGIMASGIMIRNICPLIKDKTRDPAILIMDEKSKHVVSILSGHLGGGNEFTLKIAELTGAEPVITTATDVNGKLGLDTLARKYFMEVDNPSSILQINKALVDSEKIELSVPPRFEYLFEDELVKNSYKQFIGQTSSPNKIEASFDNVIVTLTPKKIVVGIGARKGVSREAVLSAVSHACHDLGIPMERIDLIATAEPKKDETGILETAKELDVELKVVPLDMLKSFKHPEISESPFVQKTFGVPGICEPAALFAAGVHASLIYRKTSFNKVTIAVVVNDS